MNIDDIFQYRYQLFHIIYIAMYIIYYEYKMLFLFFNKISIFYTHIYLYIWILILITSRNLSIYSSDHPSITSEYIITIESYRYYHRNKNLFDDQLSRMLSYAKSRYPSYGIPRIYFALLLERAKRPPQFQARSMCTKVQFRAVNCHGMSQLCHYAIIKRLLT